MTGILEKLQALLYPALCLLCGTREALADGLDLCRDCLRELPSRGIACERCAAQLKTCPGSAVWCGHCLANPPPFERSWTLGPYREGLAALVNMLKYQRRLEAGRLLGLLLGRFLAAHPECRSFVLVPVPLHPSRLRQRGFNQSAEIARWAARHAGLAVLHSAAVRLRKTAPQTGLGAAARGRNLRGAFVAQCDLSNRRIAIIDDVMTTGSTVASLAAALKKAGCPRIEIWCCARASLQ